MATHPAARSATFTILKGGVGKTTQTALIADAAVRLGLNTLVIDTDSQANLSRLMGCEVELVAGETRDLSGKPVLVTDRYTVEDIMGADVSDGLARHAISDAGPGWQFDPALPFEVGGPLFPGRLGRLGVIPSYAGLEMVSTTWSNADLRRLRDSLYEPDPDGIVPATEWDLILIDCPPAPGPLARLAVAAADQVLIVSQATDFAVDATGKTLDFLHAFLSDGYVKHPISIAGVAMNGWDERLNDQQENVNRLVEILDERVPGGFEKALWPEPIPRRTVVGKAATAHKPVSGELRTTRTAAETVCRVAESHTLILAENLGVPGIDAIRAEWESARGVTGGEDNENVEVTAHA